MLLHSYPFSVRHVVSRIHVCWWSTGSRPWTSDRCLAQMQLANVGWTVHASPFCYMVYQRRTKCDFQRGSPSCDKLLGFLPAPKSARLLEGKWNSYSGDPSSFTASLNSQSTICSVFVLVEYYHIQVRWGSPPSFSETTYLEQQVLIADSCINGLTPFWRQWSVSKTDAFYCIEQARFLLCFLKHDEELQHIKAE